MHRWNETAAETSTRAAIEVRAASTRREMRRFLTFPWSHYRNDPLWVPPILKDRRELTDPARGRFFKNGSADFFTAWKQGRPAGTICCAEDRAITGYRGEPECMIGFFECIEDYEVAEALFGKAEEWAGARGMKALYGTYNLDREEGRGILVDGYERPAPILCGHNPPYYAGYFERSGFELEYDDNLAYRIDIDLESPQFRRLVRLAATVRSRNRVTVRSARMGDVEGEIDRIWELQNRSLSHLRGFTPYSRENIESIVLPLRDIADPELVLFAEVDGRAVGWLPAVPNLNEILIHLNGLRYPWDYLRLLLYRGLKPRGISIKSVVILPEYRDTGVLVLLLDEMARRAAARGYTWADLSLTGEENPDTGLLARKMGAVIYKRYRFYRKALVRV